MRYHPPNDMRYSDEIENDDEDEREPVYWEGRPRFVSDQTAFMRWSTELEKVHDIIDKEFLVRNRHRVMDINKILPLAFIENPKSLQLFRLRRINIGLSTDAGLVDLADETTLDNLADYQTTRGIRGNYQKALITQRREFKDNNIDDKKSGLLNRLLRGKQDEDEQPQNMQELSY